MSLVFQENSKNCQNHGLFESFFEKKNDRSTLVTPPHDPLLITFIRNYMFIVKRPQQSKNKKVGSITPGS